MASRTPAIPGTFEEFQATWDGWVDGAIEKVTGGRYMRRSADANDLKQMVYLRILEQKHIEKFDVTKGSFTHHIYRVVLHTYSNQYDKSTRSPLTNAIPVIESAPSDGFTDLKALVLETYGEFVDEGAEKEVLMQDYFDKFERHLATTFEPWGTLIQFPDGSSRKRSLALVFRMMRQTLEAKEIAALLKVTSGSVFSYIKKIKAEAARFHDLTSLGV